METNYILSLTETFGLGVFFYYVIKGLKQQVSALNNTISIQNKTLDVMEKRINETEKIGDIYRKFISNLPDDIDNYRAVLSKTKDETILELTNQYEITKKKLSEAQYHIEKSNQTPELINHHLRILKNMISKPVSDKFSYKNQYEITKLCEYNGRTLEQSVPKIITSNTLQEFLEKLGFDVSITEEINVRKTFVDPVEQKSTPKGILLKSGALSQSRRGWYLLANDEFYINPERLSELKDEFSAIKSIA